MKIFLLCALALSNVYATAYGENSQSRFGAPWPPTQRVKQSVQFSSKNWALSYGFTWGGGRGAMSPFVFVVPPPAGPHYNFKYELVDSGSNAPGVPGMFNNLGGYFNRLTVNRPSPEEMQRRRDEYLAFKEKPWQYPNFVKAFRNLPPEISRKILNHQRDVILEKLYAVLDDKVTAENETFSTDNHRFIMCARQFVWPVDKVMSHLFLQRKDDQLFYWAEEKGTEVMKVVQGPRDFEQFLLAARDTLNNLRAEREEKCLGKEADSVFRTNLGYWAAVEKELMAYDRWFEREWAKLDKKGYKAKFPTYSRRDVTFVDVVERIDLEYELELFLNREITSLGRAPNDFFPVGREKAQDYFQYVQERYPALNQQAERIARAEVYEVALKEMDAFMKTKMDAEKELAAKWLARQKELVNMPPNLRKAEPNLHPEQYVRENLDKLQNDYLKWKKNWVLLLQEDPGNLIALREQIKKGSASPQ